MFKSLERRSLPIALALAIGITASTTTAAPLTLTQKCRAERHKILGKYSKCVETEAARAIKRNRDPDYSGCTNAYQRQWQRAEAKFAGECYQPVGFWNRAGDIVMSQHLSLKQLMNTEKQVFVSSQKYPGNFGNQRLGGGTTAFDLQCQALAHSANLGGHWISWTSSETVNAIDRMIGGGPFVRTDGVVIADSVADLTDGLLYNTIHIDERGLPILEDEAAWVWTGTDENGLLVPGRTCNSWIGDTEFTSSGWAGSTLAVDDDWTSQTWQFCDDSYHIYCIEQ